MELFARIHKDCTILTPNRRLAATITKHYNKTQIQDNQHCWESLDALPFSSWIQRLWLNYCATYLEDHPFLLTPQQEQVLWEEILTASPTNEALLQLSATADLAKSAWTVLKQWRIDSEQPDYVINEDTHAFQQWASEFKETCFANHWLDANSLLDFVSEKIIEDKIPLPTQLILMGFTEYTPQQTHFLSLCEQKNVSILYHAEIVPPHLQTIQRIQLLDEAEEIQTMAAWAFDLHQKHPEATIGCVIPHLEKARDRVAQAFSEAFSENTVLNLDPTTLPFNISAGKSLASYPIIHAALQLLNMNTSHITSHDIGYLLHTPFIGDAESERLKRAKLDTKIRHLNQHYSSLTTLLDENSLLQQHCPRLAECLHIFNTILKNAPNESTPSTWTSVFVELLSAVGWPGERSVNSQEYQLIQRWLELLQEYQNLNQVQPKLSYQAALHHLQRMAMNTVFQIQSPDAPVQILGLLEAAEIPFDYLWVMGLSDTTWPPAAKPNPFIPNRLQKTLNMPHASAEKEYTYSKQLTKQLQQSATFCIFSYPEKSADAELRPSSLIIDLPEIALTDLSLSLPQSLIKTVFNTKEIELFHDAKANAIHDNEPVRGGVRIFKQQAACPFKAFAEIRLHAQELESLQMGLRAQDRGTIVHKALEIIWQQLDNSETLAQYSEEELTALIEHASTQAIEKSSGKKLSDSRYLSLELQRVVNLLNQWLQLEKSRPFFKVVAQEKEIQTQIGPISFNLRVDRIDELNNGTQLIIDYKTGVNNHVKYWFSDRPEEPQLPLYCLMDTKQAAGIAFAEVHPDSITFKGVSKAELDISAIQPITKIEYVDNRNWDEQILHWQTVLTQLGHEFYSGKASVNPKNKETCQYCKLQPFCRIYEKMDPVC